MYPSRRPGASRSARTAAIASTLAALLLAAACSSGGDPSFQPGADSSAAPSAPIGGSEPGAPSSDSGAFEERTISVDQAVWHSGFRIEVGEVTLFAEERFTGGFLYYVSVDARFENLGDDENSIRAPVNLVADGLAAIRADDRTDLPFVPSGLTSAGTLAYLVEEDFDVTDAHLLVGSGEDKEARIPIGPEGGELIALAPTLPDVSGSIFMELIDLEFTSAELRSDVPANYEEVGPGELALTLDFDAVSRRSGNWNIRAENFSLVGPDGNALSVDGSGLQNLLGSEVGTLTPDHYIRFVIAEPAVGDYQLRFTPPDPFVGEDGVTEASFDFALS